MSSNNSKIHFILLAAGNSTRFSQKNNKLLIKFKNKSILEYNLSKIKEQNFHKITIVINKIKLPKNQLFDKIEVIKGGKTRSLSVKNALINSKYSARYVMVHDAARPLYSNKLINRLSDKIITGKYDCVIPYSNCSDTVLQDNIDINRKNLKLIKTPQVFSKVKLTQLHLLNDNIYMSDDSQLFRVSKKIFNIKYILDKYLHLKVTYKEDIDSVNELLKLNSRVGIGYDIHRIEKGFKNNSINLAGIKIKSKVNVISHSDGDVILHAITDSILGALSMRDIGTYFPNNKKNLNRNSKEFLNYALSKMDKEKFKINNIDLMIVSEEPKINPYYKKIIKKLINLLNLNENQITIKATTNEKSGLIGKGDFIACWSNISLIEN